MAEPLLRVENVSVRFPVRAGALQRRVGTVEAVERVSLHVDSGEILGIVGESGCGKTTLARTIAGLQPADSGRIVVAGVDVTSMEGKASRRARRGIQMVFQDPFGSLNPRMTVRQLVTESWQVYPDLLPKSQWEDELHHLLDRVGLRPEHADRLPHQFSGGQRQRIGIARSLAGRPSLLVCDEPVSALDVSIQAQVIRLLLDLQQDLGLSYLFISHDLNVVRLVADRVAVMYLGRIVEEGDARAVYRSPVHPYTQALLSAAPSLRPDETRGRVLLTGDVPSNIDLPSGCRFRTRCWKAAERCASDEPELELRGFDHPSACHFADREVAGAEQRSEH